MYHASCCKNFSSHWSQIQLYQRHFSLPLQIQLLKFEGPPNKCHTVCSFCFWTGRKMKPRSKTDRRPIHFFVINADVRCIIFQCSRVSMHGLANFLILIFRCGIHCPLSIERTCTLESIYRERRMQSSCRKISKWQKWDETPAWLMLMF